jgi:hypothetical protein
MIIRLIWYRWHLTYKYSFTKRRFIFINSRRYLQPTLLCWFWRWHDRSDHHLRSYFNRRRSSLCTSKSWRREDNSGPDKIPAVLLKNCAASIAPSLCELFNKSLSSGQLILYLMFIETLLQYIYTELTSPKYY